MKEPFDCSWIWGNVLKLHMVALPYINFRLGNGLYLASCDTDFLIAQFGLPTNAKVHDIIWTGRWMLPTSNAHHHHVAKVHDIIWTGSFTSCLHQFDFPVFDLNKDDVIIWNEVPLSKLKVWHIWNATRFKLPEVPWEGFVWHRLQVNRYAHYEWLLCLDCLPTLHKLASFGWTFYNIVIPMLVD